MTMQPHSTPFRLPRDCTVERIAEIHRALLDRFSTDASVLVDISEVAEVDVTIVQLALALEIAGKNAEKTIIWQGGPSAPITRALHLTGQWKNPLLDRLAAVSGEP